MASLNIDPSVRSAIINYDKYNHEPDHEKVVIFKIKNLNAPEKILLLNEMKSNVDFVKNHPMLVKEIVHVKSKPAHEYKWWHFALAFIPAIFTYFRNSGVEKNLHRIEHQVESNLPWKKELKEMEENAFEKAKKKNQSPGTLNRQVHVTRNKILKDEVWNKLNELKKEYLADRNDPVKRELYINWAAEALPKIKDGIKDFFGNTQSRPRLNDPATLDIAKLLVKKHKHETLENLFNVLEKRLKLPGKEKHYIAVFKEYQKELNVSFGEYSLPAHYYQKTK